MTDEHVQKIQATLIPKKFQLDKFTILADFSSNRIFLNAEQQSVASADRKGDQKQGKKPDVMFMECSEKKFYKLILVESSCIVCTKIKEENDSVKLWREMNNEFHMEKFQSEDEVLEGLT
ncbi:uncharacterized protein OCT59_020961 [Rhizophagus irregularis]|nr:hypothetical protein OCT59_020961 [Rhizophagus irregularis]